MNKIVRDHYPVSRLPQDLQAEIGKAKYVRVVIEQEESRPTPSREDLLRLLEDARGSARGITTEEAVSRVRALRDEWDDRHELQPYTDRR